MENEKKLPTAEATEAQALPDEEMVIFPIE